MGSGNYYPCYYTVWSRYVRGFQVPTRPDGVGWGGEGRRGTLGGPFWSVLRWCPTARGSAVVALRNGSWDGAWRFERGEPGNLTWKLAGNCELTTGHWALVSGDLSGQWSVVGHWKSWESGTRIRAAAACSSCPAICRRSTPKFSRWVPPAQVRTRTTWQYVRSTDTSCIGVNWSLSRADS